MTDGDLADYTQRCEALVEWATRFGIPWVLVSHAQLGIAHFWNGRWDEALGPLEQSAETEFVAGTTRGLGSGPLLQVAAYTKPKDEALRRLMEPAHVRRRNTGRA